MVNPDMAAMLSFPNTSNRNDASNVTQISPDFQRNLAPNAPCNLVENVHYSHPRSQEAQCPLSRLNSAKKQTFLLIKSWQHAAEKSYLGQGTFQNVEKTCLGTLWQKPKMTDGELLIYTSDISSGKWNWMYTLYMATHLHTSTHTHCMATHLHTHLHTHGACTHTNTHTHTMFSKKNDVF